MKSVVAFSFLLAAGTGFPDDFGTWSEASPNKALFAIERRIPDPSELSRLDLDGFAVFICNSESGTASVVTPGSVIAQRSFPLRLVSQMRWSPDSQFLLFTTASSGGHSPWHFKTFLFCVADRSFRNVEDMTGGSVEAPDFHFEPPDIAVLTTHDIAAPETNAKKKVKLALGKAFQHMQRLQ